MSSLFEDGPLPEWKEVSDWLGKDLPRKLVEKFQKADDMEWLDRFVKGLMKQSQDEQRSSPKMSTKSVVRMETEKDAKRVTVTVNLPPQTDMHSLQLFASSDRLKVTGLPDERTHAVRFPCRVYPRSGRASMEGDRIVVKFRRRPADQNEVELFIRT